MRHIFMLIMVFGIFSGDAFSHDMADYWPNPAMGEQLIVQDATTAYGPETLTVLSRYRKGGTVDSLPVIQLDEYTATGGWLDAWEYRFDATNGVLEVADKYPSSVHKVFKIGNEIKWGGSLNVGNTIAGNVEVDLTKSTNVPSGPSIYGYHSMTLEEFIPSFTNDGGLTFSNVIKVYVFQSWCSTSTCNYPAGQNVWQIRYWLAPGVGVIQKDYLAPTVRRDYAKSVTLTVAMPNSQ